MKIVGLRLLERTAAEKPRTAHREANIGDITNLSSAKKDSPYTSNSDYIFLCSSS